MIEKDAAQQDVMETLFNNDLNFGGVIVKEFTPKKEFEIQGLFSKITKYIKTGDEIDYDNIMEKIGYDQCLKISNWMNTNTNVTEKLDGLGDIMSKVIIFINIFFDYTEHKKKLKK